MVKQVATLVLNRLVVLAALWLAVNAFARSGCHAGSVAFQGLGDVVSSLGEVARALR